MKTGFQLGKKEKVELEVKVGRVSRKCYVIDWYTAIKNSLEKKT